MKKGIAYFGLVSLMVFVLGLATASAEEIPVYVDIKPTSCPNPLNVNMKGVLPVAILGTGDFDVATIDPATILLGDIVAPLRWALDDVATPYNGASIVDFFDCTTEGPDDLDDLVLFFDSQYVVEALELVYADNRSEMMIELTGNLWDSTPIRGGDVVIIVKPGFMDQPK